MILLILLMTVVSLMTPQTLAQESPSEKSASRVEQIDQERSAKERRLKPDEPDKLEHYFNKYGYVVNGILAAPPAGLRPKLSSSAPGWGGLVRGSGLSFGPEYYRPDLASGEIVFRTSAVITVRSNYLFDTS